MKPRARILVASALFGAIVCTWTLGSLIILISVQWQKSVEVDIVEWTVFVLAWGLPVGYKSLQMAKSCFTPQEWRTRTRAAAVVTPLIVLPLAVLWVAIVTDDIPLFSAAAYLVILGLAVSLGYSIYLNRKSDSTLNKACEV